MKRYVVEVKWKLIGGFLAILCTNFFSLLRPRVLGLTVDAIKVAAPFQRVTHLAGEYLLLAVVQGFFLFLMRRLIVNASRDVEYRLRNDFFQHLQRLSLSFFDRTKIGDLVARATNDLNAVRNVLGPGTLVFLNTVVTFPAAVFFMLRIDSALTAYALIPMVGVTLMVYSLRMVMRKRFERIQEQYSTLSSKVQENFAGIRVVKAYTMEDREINEFREMSDEYMRREMDWVRIWGFFFPSLGMMASLGLVIILAVGGSRVISGTISVGDLAAFINYAIMMTWPMAGLGFVINFFQQGAASMKRINQIMSETPDITDAPDAVKADALRGEIEFRNLTFSYGGGRPPALHNVNLKIKPGQTVAIVGHTGSGKTTLVDLIPRLYDPSPGTLFIDGIDVRKIPLPVLRRNVGYVPQETFLFSDTIKENIAFGLSIREGDGNGDDSQGDGAALGSIQLRPGVTPEADESAIRRAAAVARILDTVEEFPRKFDTLLGEKGVNLSGGQRQRTAIARAVILNPRILILDDALSSVDTQTEEEILQELVRLRRERTCIIISHRVSSVQTADRIIVLEEGRIAEAGTHAELLAKDGIYADMYRKQLLREQLDLDVTA